MLPYFVIDISILLVKEEKEWKRTCYFVYTKSCLTKLCFYMHRVHLTEPFAFICMHEARFIEELNIRRERREVVKSYLYYFFSLYFFSSFYLVNLSVNPWF